MPKEILVNGITLEGANIVPLLLKIKKWQSLGCSVSFFGVHALREQIEQVGIIREYNFIEFFHGKKTTNRISFIFESLRRNFLAIFNLRFFIGKFDIVYTISPVLDLILLPYFLRKFDKKIKWFSVFDNSVPLLMNGKFVAGNKIIRLLAWVFYKVSLLFLHSADCVFVIKSELVGYMLNHGFTKRQLVITGNGVEKDLIVNAKKMPDYNIDALFVGRINEAKGIYDMLKVLEIVKEKMANFQLAIMGKGDNETEKKFRERIVDIKLENNIKFLGYKIGQEKFNIIKSSKTFLFLSETESVPIAPLEAVCSGLKTLVYDLDAYNMYKNNEIIIFKKNDYKSVAEKIIDIFESDDFKNDKGKLLVERYSWDAISELEHSFF